MKDITFFFSFFNQLCISYVWNVWIFFYKNSCLYVWNKYSSKCSLTVSLLSKSCSLNFQWTRLQFFKDRNKWKFQGVVSGEYGWRGNISQPYCCSLWGLCVCCSLELSWWNMILLQFDSSWIKNSKLSCLILKCAL